MVSFSNDVRWFDEIDTIFRVSKSSLQFMAPQSPVCQPPWLWSMSSLSSRIGYFASPEFLFSAQCLSKILKYPEVHDFFWKSKLAGHGSRPRYWVGHSTSYGIACKLTSDVIKCSCENLWILSKVYIYYLSIGSRFSEPCYWYVKSQFLVILHIHSSEIGKIKIIYCVIFI